MLAPDHVGDRPVLGKTVGIFHPWFHDAEPDVVIACKVAVTKLEQAGAKVGNACEPVPRPFQVLAALEWMSLPLWRHVCQSASLILEARYWYIRVSVGENACMRL